MITRVVTFLALVIGCTIARASDKPNVIIILADDLGYGDVGYAAVSEKDMVTPNIDRLAENGVQFTSGYTMHAVCGPSRAGLLTGRYQQRFGYHDNIGPRVRQPGIERGLPLSEKTFGDYFKQLGYVTGMIGKWHDGDEDKFWPRHRGFDETYCFNNGAANYFVGPKNDANRTPKWSAIHRGGTRLPAFDEYLTDAFGRESVEFVQRHKDERFCLFLSFNAVHGPMQATRQDLDRFAHIANRDRRACVAMNYNMDLNIGRLLDQLESSGLTKKTLVFFYSDNGGNGMPKNSSNRPLRGYKGETLEGGIRVPFVVQWKGTIPAGRALDEPVIAMDIVATALRAAGFEMGAAPKLEGIDLMPYMTGRKTGLKDRYLFWDNSVNWAVRDREWKLVSTSSRGGSPRGRVNGLFRLSNDKSESRDLAGAYPEVAKRLETALERWQAKNEAPRFGWGAHVGPSVGYRGKFLPDDGRRSVVD